MFDFIINFVLIFKCITPSIPNMDITTAMTMRLKLKFSTYGNENIFFYNYTIIYFLTSILYFFKFSFKSSKILWDILVEQHTKIMLTKCQNFVHFIADV